MPRTSSSLLIKKQDGNVLIIILIAMALIAALTVAIQGSSQNNAHIDKETLILRASEIRQYASELERGVAYIMQNSVSESDIRFAHPLADIEYGDLNADTDKSDQMFAREGGGAQYKAPPSDINNGEAWEFYGHTSLPDAGSSAADLVAVLPNVTEAFCAIVNSASGYSGQPQDSGTCIHGGAAQRFDDGTQFSGSPNTTTEASFSIKPAKEGCIECTSDNSFHFFHVLMSR